MELLLLQPHCESVIYYHYYSYSSYYYYLSYSSAGVLGRLPNSSRRCTTMLWSGADPDLHEAPANQEGPPSGQKCIQLWVYLGTVHILVSFSFFFFLLHSTSTSDVSNKRHLHIMIIYKKAVFAVPSVEKPVSPPRLQYFCLCDDNKTNTALWQSWENFIELSHHLNWGKNNKLADINKRKPAWNCV